MEKELSIIIVSWNTRDLLKACLLSIRNTAHNISLEIIVVDNASEDGSPEVIIQEFPEVILVQAGCNLGFAAANNMGMAMAKGRYFCLINSDVIVQPDCLQVLVKYMDCNPDAGITGPRILNPDYSLQKSVTCYPSLLDSWGKALLIHRLLALLKRNNTPNSLYTNHIVKDVPVIYGMFWMVSRKAWQKVGGLDERFFMYGEDLDWCKRFRDGLLRVVYVPYATAIHFGGGSSRLIPIKSAIQLRKSRILFFNKHHSVISSILNLLGMITESFTRIIIWTLISLFRLHDHKLVNINLSRHFSCLKWLLAEGTFLVFNRPEFMSS